MLRFQGRDKQNRFNRTFSTTMSGKYYIVPLQVHSDSQITQRSDLRSMEEFYSPCCQFLFKHAPAIPSSCSRFTPWTAAIKTTASSSKSCRPSLMATASSTLIVSTCHTLDHARGCVTINSSVGLAALIHGAPTITLGEAAYNLRGLTFQGKLNAFWKQHGEVESKHVHDFVNLLKLTSQAQGTLLSAALCCPRSQQNCLARRIPRNLWPVMSEDYFSVHDLL